MAWNKTGMSVAICTQSDYALLKHSEFWVKSEGNYWKSVVGGKNTNKTDASLVNTNSIYL